MKTDIMALAEVAQAALVERLKFDTAPPFDELSETLRNDWVAVAEAVIVAFGKQHAGLFSLMQQAAGSEQQIQAAIERAGRRAETADFLRGMERAAQVAEDIGGYSTREYGYVAKAIRAEIAAIQKTNAEPEGVAV